MPKAELAVAFSVRIPPAQKRAIQALADARQRIARKNGDAEAEVTSGDIAREWIETGLANAVNG